MLAVALEAILQKEATLGGTQAPSRGLASGSAASRKPQTLCM